MWTNSQPHFNYMSLTSEDKIYVYKVILPVGLEIVGTDHCFLYNTETKLDKLKTKTTLEIDIEEIRTQIHSKESHCRGSESFLGEKRWGPQGTFGSGSVAGGTEAMCRGALGHGKARPSNRYTGCQDRLQFAGAPTSGQILPVCQFCCVGSF